jgi:hypothetical protein
MFYYYSMLLYYIKVILKGKIITFHHRFITFYDSLQRLGIIVFYPCFLDFITLSPFFQRGVGGVKNILPTYVRACVCDDDYLL